MNLPADIAKYIIDLAQSIPDEDLAGSGREQVPHITVKYGLHENDPTAVQNLLAKQSMPQARLLETAVFPGVENGTMDAVILNVDSADLCNLNKIISNLPHTDTSPTYKPHVTVAYVKFGLGQKHAGNKILKDTVITFPELTYSGKDGIETTISFLPRNSDHTITISDEIDINSIVDKIIEKEELNERKAEKFREAAALFELALENKSGKIPIYRRLTVKDPETTIESIKNGREPGIHYSYSSEGFIEEESANDWNVEIEAELDITQVDIEKTLEMNAIYPDEMEIEYSGSPHLLSLKNLESGKETEIEESTSEETKSGEVHVSAHTREGGNVEVKEHTRSYPERDMSPLGVSFTDYYVDYWFEDEVYCIIDERFKLGVWTAVTRWRGQDVQNMEVQAYKGPDGKRRYRTRVKKAQKPIRKEERTGEQVDMSLDRLKELRKKHVDDIQPITLAEDALEVVRTDFAGMGQAAPIGHVPENLDKLLKNSIALQAKLADLDSQLRMAERRQKIRGGKGLLLKPTANEDLKELIELYEDAADRVGAMTRRFFDRLDEWKDQSGMGTLNTELDNWKLPDGDVNAKDVANATHNAMFELNKLPAYLRHSLKVFKNGVNISKGGIYSSAANTSITSKEEIQEQHRWAGVYFPGKEGKVIVEFKQYGMGNTIVHEVAHAIDFEVLGITSLPAHEWKPTRLGRSFVKFWKDQKLQFEEYGQTDVSEGFATGLTTYLDVPEWMKQHQPVIYKWFKDNIGESRKERQWQEFVKESTKEYEKKELARKKLHEQQSKGEF